VKQFQAELRTDRLQELQKSHFQIGDGSAGKMKSTQQASYREQFTTPERVGNRAYYMKESHLVLGTDKVNLISNTKANMKWIQPKATANTTLRGSASVPVL
jgi:hypothetical protein